MSDEPDNDALELVDSLDLTGSIDRLRTVGAMRKEFHLEYSRDLTEGDMAALELPRPRQPRAIQRIHASHHSLARCLAAGMKQQQASLVTGYSLARIQQLLADQSFKDLVEDYRIEARSVFADLAERMNDLSLDAIELIQERLHAAPAEFTIPVLLDMVKTFADRTGHGPGHEVKLTLDRDLIDRPPRETAEEWTERRARELKGYPELKKLN